MLRGPNLIIALGLRKVQNASRGREANRVKGAARLLITTKASNDEIHQKIITAPVSILSFETRKTLGYRVSKILSECSL